MNIYLHELRAYRKMAITWTAVLLGITALYMSMFGSMTKDMEAFTNILASLPPAMKAAIGMPSPEKLATALGFYSFVFTFVALCGGIQAMIIGVGIISKETRERTADFLMAKPASRPRIFTAKLCAALTVLLATNTVYQAGSMAIISAAAGRELDGWACFLVSLSLLFIQLTLFAVGLVISVSVRRLRAVLPTALGATFGFFAIGMLADTAGDDKLRYLSPFKYFPPLSILIDRAYEVKFLAVAAGVVAVGIAVSAAIYCRKDVVS